jgi:hypothetical protein
MHAPLNVPRTNHRCLQRPESIAALLGLLPQHLDTLDARRFITRIPADAHIEGLRDKLTNILATYTLETSLRQGSLPFVTFRIRIPHDARV